MRDPKDEGSIPAAAQTSIHNINGKQRPSADEEKDDQGPRVPERQETPPPLGVQETGVLGKARREFIPTPGTLNKNKGATSSAMKGKWQGEEGRREPSPSGGDATEGQPMA